MPRSSLIASILVAGFGCASTPPPATGAPAAAATTAAPASVPAAAAAKARTPAEILSDAVTATGGAAAWNAHKTAHYKMETTLQGMGMGGKGERYATRGNKSLTIIEMAGLGQVREGTNGKVVWTEDPLMGLRLLDGAEAEQTRSDRRGTPRCTRRSCSRSSSQRPSRGRTARRSSA